MNTKMGIAALAVVMACTTAGLPAAHADAVGGDAVVSAAEVAVSLSHLDALSPASVSEPTRSTSDADSATTARSADGSTVDVPRNAEAGISMTTAGGDELSVSLPGDTGASPATRLSDGTVAYPSKEGFASAVVPNQDGVQLLTTIADSAAPEVYDYTIDLPAGGGMTLLEGGAVAVTNSAGESIRMISPAFARDRNGTPVKSYYTVSGNVLTQHVEHRGTGAAYPLVADPSFGSRIINMLLGCVGLRDLARMGLAKAIWAGGRKVIARALPYVGWVSCGVGAYAGWDS